MIVRAKRRSHENDPPAAAKKISLGPTFGPGEPGAPPGALNPQHLGNAAVVLGDVLPSPPADQPVHAKGNADKGQIRNQRLPGMCGKLGEALEGKNGGAEQQRQKPDRPHHPGLLQYRHVRDRPADLPQGRDRVGPGFRPFEPAVVGAGAPGQFVDPARIAEARIEPGVKGSRSIVPTREVDHERLVRGARGFAGLRQIDAPDRRPRRRVEDRRRADLAARRQDLAGLGIGRSGHAEVDDPRGSTEFPGGLVPRQYRAPAIGRAVRNAGSAPGFRRPAVQIVLGMGQAGAGIEQRRQSSQLDLGVVQKRVQPRLSRLVEIFEIERQR